MRRCGPSILGRWCRFYEPAGYDGLVVLAMVQARHAPPRFLANGFTAQDYTLLLEHGAIRHFAAIECDPRLGNTSFNAGRAEVTGAPAHCVYVAFKFAQTNENAAPVALNLTELGLALPEVKPGPGPLLEPSQSTAADVGGEPEEQVSERRLAKLAAVTCDRRVGNSSFNAGRAEVTGAPVHAVRRPLPEPSPPTADDGGAEPEEQASEPSLAELNAALHAALDEMLDETD